MEAKEILEGKLKKSGLPVAEEEYFGKKSRYITYVEAAENGINYADNEPDDNKTSFQVHYFCPLQEDDSREVAKQIRKLLETDNIFIGATTRMRDKDAEKRHVIITCDIVTKH